jgi:hypothetical protein
MSTHQNQNSFTRFLETPFWRKYWYWICFLIVCIFATALRFYKLAEVPHGMTWDEAAIGYNGYAIFTTRRDEWLVRLPISFKSFGDYKAPLAIYLNGVSTYLFGMNLWAVRFPFAVAGVWAVIGIMLLSKILLEKVYSPRSATNLSLLMGVLITFSPWHLNFSRAGFESGIALTFFIWGSYFLFKFLFSISKNWLSLIKNTFFSLLSGICFVASIYTYHSAKIVIPLIGFIIFCLFFKEFWKQKIFVVLEVIVSYFLLRPFIEDTLYSSGGERLNQVSIFGLDISFGEKILLFIQHYFTHFSLQFLIFGETTTLRHGDGKWGVLYPTTFVFVCCGVVLFLWQILKKKMVWPKLRIFLLSIFLVLIGIIPAAIGRDVPHSNRALFALPGFLFLCALGLHELLSILEKSKINIQVSGSKGEKNLLVKSVFGLFILLHSVFILGYLQHYYVSFSKESASDWQDGYLAAFQFAHEYEPQAEKIIFSSEYGQPYIYALFVRKTNPIWYQGGSLVKYEFSNSINEGDRERVNAVVVATPGQLIPKPQDTIIYGSDGSVRFILVKPHN